MNKYFGKIHRYFKLFALLIFLIVAFSSCSGGGNKQKPQTIIDFFTVKPETVQKGEKVKLEWQATNVGLVNGKANCVLKVDPEGLSSASEEEVECISQSERIPDRSTSYTFSALRSDNTNSFVSIDRFVTVQASDPFDSADILTANENPSMLLEDGRVASNEADYYRIDVPASLTGDLVYFELAGANLKLTLYNSNKVAIRESDGPDFFGLIGSGLGSSNLNSKAISTDVVCRGPCIITKKEAGGTMYIKIESKNGSSADYDVYSYSKPYQDEGEPENEDCGVLGTVAINTLPANEVSKGVLENVEDVDCYQINGNIESVGLQLTNNTTINVKAEIFDLSGNPHPNLSINTLRASAKSTTLHVLNIVPSQSIIARVTTDNNRAAPSGNSQYSIFSSEAFNETHALSVSKKGNGNGKVTSTPIGIDCGADCSEDYEQGKVITLEASPNAGSRFISWDGCNTVNGSTCTVTMDGKKDVVATFNQLPAKTHTLSVSKKGNGEGKVTSTPAGIDCGVNCSEDYEQGKVITLEASPNAGSRFISWDGCNTVNGSTCTVTMDGKKDVVATFNQLPAKTHTLSVSKKGNGGGKVTSTPTGIDCGADCSKDYEQGKIITLEASPNAGSIFVNWDGCDTVNGNTCTVTMDSQKDIVAHFELDSVNPRIIPTSSNCSQTAQGNDCTVTISLQNNKDSYGGLEFSISNPNFMLKSASVAGITSSCNSPNIFGNVVVILCINDFSGNGSVAEVTFTRKTSGASTFETSKSKLITSGGKEIPVEGGKLNVD